VGSASGALLPRSAKGLAWHSHTSPPTSTAARRAGRLRRRGDNQPDYDASERTWRECESKAPTKGEWEKRHAAQLSDLACNGKRYEWKEEYLAKDIYDLWLWDHVRRGDFDPMSLDSREPLIARTHARIVARHLLGLEGNLCPGAKNLNNPVKTSLRELAISNPDN